MAAIPEAVDIKPFQATFQSLSVKDKGEFTLLNLPVSFISLFFTMPSSVTGMFGFKGNYNIKKKSPELTAELVLRDTRISGEEFSLEKGEIYLANSLLNLDIDFRGLSS